MKLGNRVAAVSALVAAALAVAPLGASTAQAAEDGAAVVQTQRSAWQAASADANHSQNLPRLYRFTYYCGDGPKGFAECQAMRVRKISEGTPVSEAFLVDCSAGCTAPGVRHGWAFRWG
jgi:hypothetical protein